MARKKPPETAVRQSEESSSVRPTEPGLLSGNTLGERLTDAIDRYFAGNRSEFARQIGKNRRLLLAWMSGDKPNIQVDSLREIARVLAGVGVTLEELLGVQAGQDPPWESWREFLATRDGQSMTPEERKALQSHFWGGEPTLGQYLAMLAVHRMARPHAS